MMTPNPHRTEIGAHAKTDADVGVASDDDHMVCYNEKL
jgi:hypothetical protein